MCFFPFNIIVAARPSGVKSALVIVPTIWLCLFTTGRKRSPIVRKHSYVRFKDLLTNSENEEYFAIVEYTLVNLRQQRWSLG